MKDIEAVRKLLAKANLNVGLVGYCWGGTMAFLSAVRLDLDAAVVYYGGQILPYVDERERCPLLMHFGERDASIPMDHVEKIRKAHPRARILTSEADHGFNCNHRAQYDEASAKLARRRTLSFFADQLG